MKRLKPVLTEGQWERVLTSEEIPELDPEATAALILHTLGWFTWADALEHQRVGDLMQGGIDSAAHFLSEQDTIKTEAARYFAMQRQYQNLKAHQAWHWDMALRIGVLLPPMELLERLKEDEDEREGAQDGTVVEEVDRGGAGRAPGGSEEGGGSRSGADGSGGDEGGTIGIVR